MFALALQYRPYATERFNKSISQLDRSVQERVDKAVREIASNPYASELLKIALKGKRNYRIGDYRVIFAVCEECRRENWVELNGCSDCKKHGRNDFILFDAGHRGSIYQEIERLQKIKLGATKNEGMT
jgi:mRNA-degrading endonuclease RelE of RelBE toxin-antitoxin system